MSTESQLREKLRKIEALFVGAGTTGERLAAPRKLAVIIDEHAVLRESSFPPPSEQSLTFRGFAARGAGY